MKQAQPYGTEDHDGNGDCPCAAELADDREAERRTANRPKPVQAVLFPGAVAGEGWTQIADCEARNALQVILSGSEILLENLFGRLLPEQRMMLEKILASAHRLSIIIATLTKPEDLVGGPVSGSFTANELFGASRRIREHAD
jgi:hypothetical protein